MYVIFMKGENLLTTEEQQHELGEELLTFCP